MSSQRGEVRQVGILPWLALVLATFPAIWYVLDFESDMDPEFPRVVRPTFSAYPAPAYRFAEPGDTIDHIALYVASAALVLAAWGLIRSPSKRPWIAALALSMAGFWHAATPGPLLDGWYGLGWRTVFNPLAPQTTRWALAAALALLIVLTVWGLGAEPWPERWKRARQSGLAQLLIVSAVLLALRQVSWVDREPLGFWPRWIYVWGLLAWALALLKMIPSAPPQWPRAGVITAIVLVWLVLDFTGRGIFWYQRPLARLREVVPGRIYLSAMPTYQGLELAEKRQHFRTIINLFPEHTSQRSPYWPEELRFVRERGLQYVGCTPADDPSGEAFIIRTLKLAQDPDAWPVLVHCHASMDRSPAWMGLYRFAVQEWTLADAIREIEHHRGLRPKASVTLLYNRIVPRIAPERAAADPTVPLLRQYAEGTVDPVTQLAERPGTAQAR